MKHSNFSRKIIFLLLCIISITLCAQNGENRKFKISKNLDYFNLIFKNIDLFYVDSINPEKTIQTGIRAMLRSLDPYTEFYSEEESDNLKTLLTGNYGGVGSVIMLYKDGKTVIAEPYEGMPAAKYGLKTGDILLEINGESLKGMDVQDISEKLRGQAGSTLIIKVERPGYKSPLEFKVVRSSIQIPTVPYYGIYGDHVGYIYLNSFTGEPSKEFKQAFMALKKQGITSLIIDLRDNGGGLLDEAVTIANYFLPKGKEIVTTRGKDKKIERVYKTTSTPIDTEIPLTVLVNGNSASSSEILAGALQDYDRAVILGSRTFGKGLVQTTRSLPYGASLKITTAKYYTPSGRCVQAIDYTSHDEEGRGDRIPDSLTHVFHTATGREVRDGGGITPDITLKRPEISSLVYALNTSIDSMKNIFDFATEYCLKHPTIPSPEQFTLSDEDYNLFKQQLKNRGFVYNLRSQKLLKQLKESIKLEGYDETTAESIKQLEQMLSHDLDRDLDHFSKDIKEMITLEIIKRYYFQKGALQVLLKDDEDLERAIQIVQSPEEYQKILSPTPKNVTSKD